MVSQRILDTLFITLIVTQKKCQPKGVAALLMIPVMLIWQAAGKYPWKIKAHYFLGMIFESLAYAFLLFLIPAYILQASSGYDESFVGQIILSFGAGVYEEFVFII